MKKITEFLSIPLENTFLRGVKDKAWEIIKKYPDVFSILLLAVLCLIFLYFGLDFYPLIDVDETRYAVMSRDLINSFDVNSLMLNAVPFLEKPPLYFWLVGGSIKLFGQFSELAVRLPIAILATFITFFTYFFGKKIISRKFGLLSALVLLSSIFFLIFSHIAILDMVLTVFMTSAIYCGFLTNFCEQKNKKYFWWYFYLFMGLGFLAKGILALVLPMIIIFIYNLLTKSVKEMFKPINLLPGIIIFLAIITPWHLVMYNKYGFQFVSEYFLVHHFARFINSESIGRERPLLYFVPVFLFGFFPWSFIFIAFVIDGIKKIFIKMKNAQGKFIEKLALLVKVESNEQKMILFAVIYFVIVLAIFSSSSTKLPTYILPLFPAASLLTGYFWWVSDERSENTKLISIATLLFASVFILAGLVASFFGYWIIPIEIQSLTGRFWSISILALYLLSMFLVLRLNTKRAISIFSGYIFFMLFVIILAVSEIFNLVYNGGENEIVAFSKVAQTQASPLVTFDFAVKPSAMIPYEGTINFITDTEFDKLDKSMNTSIKPSYVIVKNKNMYASADYRAEIQKRLDLVKQGEKYSLFVEKEEGRPRNTVTFFFEVPSNY